MTMSDRSVALVPVASGYFQSPELFARGRTVDTGLLAEALIFYDRVLVHVDNPHQFADLISWLVQQGLTQSELLRLIREDTLQIYNYAFTTNPHVEPSNGYIYGLWNIQDQVMIKPNSFPERFLKFEGLRNSFSTLKQYERFCVAVDGKVIEVKADDIGSAGVINSWRDFLNPDRNALISRRLIGEMYGVHRQGRTPRVNVTVNPIDSGEAFDALVQRQSSASRSILVRTPEEVGCGLHEVIWDFDLTSLRGLEGPRIIAGATLPLSAAAMANKYIWSARTLKCDMYLPRSIDSIVGDKLYEASEEISKGQRNTRNRVRRLELKTAFPDIRKHVNSDRVDFNEVLRIRRHSQTRRFRRFLRTAPPSEQDALNAYLYESAQAAGFSKIPKRVWPLLTIAAAATGSAIGSSISHDPATGSLVGGLLGGSASYLIKTAAAFAEWRPKIFGDWYGTEIAKLLKKAQKK
jgi:hypothetical protein